MPNITLSGWYNAGLAGVQCWGIILGVVLGIGHTKCLLGVLLLCCLPQSGRAVAAESPTVAVGMRAAVDPGL